MEVVSNLYLALGAIQPEYVPLYLIGGAILIIVQYLLSAAYNVFLHPLRKYPGPKLAAASYFCFIYHVIRGDEAIWFAECHEKYGEVFRYGPNKLSYISPQAWKDITGYQRPELAKDMKTFFKPEENGEYQIMTEPSTQEHGKLRKVFSNAFSDRALKLQEPLIRTYVEKLKQIIDKAVALDRDTHLDLVKLYNFTTFDIMGDLTFGEPLGMLDTGKYTPWVETVFGGIKNNSLLRMTRYYPLLGFILKMFIPTSVQGKRLEHFNHSVERVNKRLEKGTDIGKQDIWKLVLEKNTLPLSKMHSNASIFMIAGTETTATALSGLTYLLLVNPSKMKKLVEEVRALPEKDLTLEKLPHLSYLNACLEEAMRCYPPVPTPIPREVPRGGALICGGWVPEKTTVGVSQRAAYYSFRNFRNPKDFIPERWLPGTGYDTDRKDVLQPFSYGPRNCIGKNLAYHEMRLIAATILWHYNLELCPQSKDWMNQKTYTFWDKPGLMVKVRSVRN